MKQIRIKIKDKNRASEVSHLLDSPRLEKYILKIRTKLGIRKKLIPYRDFDRYWKLEFDYKLAPDELSYYENLIERLELLKTQNASPKEIGSLEDEIAAWQDPRHNFLMKIDEILKKFSKGEEFRNIFIKAICCGEVKEEDFALEIKRQVTENIFRDRELYWWNKRLDSSTRLGYQKIATKTGLNIRTVESAIKSFIKRLL